MGKAGGRIRRRGKYLGGRMEKERLDSGWEGRRMEGSGKSTMGELLWIGTADRSER